MNDVPSAPDAADAPNDSPPESERDFERALEELEMIVERMESDPLSLDEALVHYERGVRALGACRRALDAAEQKIEVLSGAPADSDNPAEPGGSVAPQKPQPGGPLGPEAGLGREPRGGIRSGDAASDVDESRRLF